MAFATPGEYKNVTIEIKSVAETMGRDGPQWQLEVAWPWNTARVPTNKCWLDQDKFQKPALGTHNVVALCKNVNPQYDGAHGWMYNWGISEFGGEGGRGAPASQSSNGHASQPLTDNRQAQIAWNSAINNAVSLYGPVQPGETLDFAVIQEWASFLYPMIMAGPPADIPPEGSESHVQASPEPETAERSADHQYCDRHQAPMLQTKQGLGHPYFFPDGTEAFCKGTE